MSMLFINKNIGLVSYRIEDAIAFLVGAELTNNLTLGYA